MTLKNWLKISGNQIFLWSLAFRRIFLTYTKQEQQAAMALIVQKFGGTSVANPQKIKAVAERVMGYSRKGHRMVVVLSAMAGETNRFVDLANQMQMIPDPREMDVLLATGEQATIALFAMAVKEAGLDAISLLGDQVRITTDRM